jgi:hypothetical protein
MNKISREGAAKEVTAWLDFKKITEKKRETYKDNIENLIDSMSEGNLTLDEKTFEFTHTLKFQIEGEAPLTTLKYKPRITVEKVQVHLQGVRPNDNYGLINAYIAALTTQPKSVIKQLDTEDYSVAYGIAVFFM